MRLPPPPPGRQLTRARGNLAALSTTPQMRMETRPFTELYPREQLVYLTADSPHILRTLEADKVYIIGGLVDRNRHKVAHGSSASAGHRRCDHAGTALMRMVGGGARPACRLARTEPVLSTCDRAGDRARPAADWRRRRYENPQSVGRQPRCASLCSSAHAGTRRHAPTTAAWPGGAQGRRRDTTVFEILVHFRETGSWASAMEAVLPQRKEFQMRAGPAAAESVVDAGALDSEADNEDVSTDAERGQDTKRPRVGVPDAAAATAAPPLAAALPPGDRQGS